MTNVHDFTLKTIDGEEKSLADYRGQALLLVNVASRCGLTPQYTELEKLYRERAEEGLVVLGFPCNDFGAQEPGTETQIKEFCSTSYDVTFPLFAKIHVKGPEQAPLYGFLTSQQTAPDGPGAVKWNFAKFVVDGAGNIVARFAPTASPIAHDVQDAIDRALDRSK